MKATAIWSCCFWLALLLECSGKQWFPAASLVIPLAVACLFYEKNTRSILLAGLALLARWFLNPEWPPVEIAVTIAGSVWLLQRQLDDEHRFGATGGVSVACLMLMTLIAIATVIVLQVVRGLPVTLAFWQYAITSGPLVALLAVVATLKRSIVVR